MCTLHTAGVSQVEGFWIFVKLVSEYDPLERLLIDGIVDLQDLSYAAVTALQALLWLQSDLINTVQFPPRTVPSLRTSTVNS